MNLARLNHILLPDTKERRDRLRASPAGRWIARPLAWVYFGLSREGRAAALLCGLAMAAGLDVERTQSYLLASGLLGLLVAAFAVRPWFDLAALDLELEIPGRVLLGSEVELRLTLHNRGRCVLRAIRIERPILSWDGQWLEPPPALVGLDAGERLTLAIRARFEARGAHQLDDFVIAALVPPGLAQGRIRRAGGARFVVIPRPARVRSLSLHGVRRLQPGGVPLASKTGESSELRGLRPYRRGDRIRDLHAKSWARLGTPIVRVYQQGYFSRIGLVLDTDRAGSGEAECEAAISLAAGFIAVLSSGDALVDVLVTGQELVSLSVGGGPAFVDRALEHLASIEPGPPHDTAKLLGTLEPHLARLSSVVGIMLAWDPGRRALFEAISRRGLECRLFQVSAAPPMSDDIGRTTRIGVDGAVADPTHIGVGTITSGRPLGL